MTEDVIHKINITSEAKVDVCECIGLKMFDWRTLKKEVEEYIMYQSKAGRIPWWGYFRCDYVDEDSGKQLMLFFYKGLVLGKMQTWDLTGVCEAEDWTQYAEDEGKIRNWLETKVKDIPSEDDWVINIRVNKVLNETEKTLWINVLEELKNEFECSGDQKLAKELFLLQGTYFGYYGRRKRKKKAVGN